MNEARPIHDMAYHAEWLAKRIQDRSLGLDVTVSFRPDGVVVFMYRRGEARVPVLLAVGRSGATGQNTRFGLLFAAPGVPAEAGSKLAAYTLHHLEKAFPDQPPFWMRRRNQDVAEVGWSATFLQRFCGDLIVPALTCWRDARLGEATFEPDSGLHLPVVDNTPFDLYVQPGDAPASGSIVGHYGALVLAVSQATALRHPLTSYVGYALWLSVPDSAKLFVFDEYNADMEPYQGGAVAADAFLMGDLRDCEAIPAALFGSRGNLAMVYNLDRECANGMKWIPGAIPGTQVDTWAIQPSLEFLRHWNFADLNDLDLVGSGGESRVTSLIQQEASRNPEFYFLFNGCAGHLMGDDVTRCFANAVHDRSRCAPCLGLNSLTPDHDYARMWETLVERTAPPLPRQVVPGRVNLVGYGHPGLKSVQELMAILRSLGIDDVQCLLPTFDLERLPTFTTAQVTLVMPDYRVDESFTRVRPHLCGKVLSPPAPYGVRGTIAWLQTLLAALERPALTQEQETELLGRWGTAGFRATQASGSPYRAAFIASPAYLQHDTSHIRCGVDLPAVLSEQGFTLTLGVLPSQRGRVPRLPASVLARWRVADSGPAGAAWGNVVWGEAGETPEGLIARCAAPLVYSEWECDDRVLAAGMMPFSYADFEMGFGGALRTLERMQSLVEVRFSRCGSGF